MKLEKAQNLWSIPIYKNAFKKCFDENYNRRNYPTKDGGQSSNPLPRDN